eukprot:comp17916_c0_seq1/m.18192 comp17916_c0_seq1/g.18192  ORF comp17916_c0_seq1/g.18192 comp17916_c0_seq1/m.18192 type:complete len:479 (-) comp17916_c0_seq1:418-1854(-)
MPHTLSELAKGGLEKELTEKGLTPEVAAEKDKLLSRGAELLLEAGVSGDTHARAYFVPGRVEVVGKHTDYAGGRSLLAAVSRGFGVVTVDRDDNHVRIFTTFADGSKKQAEFEISPELDPSKAGASWVNYPATAVRRLARNFGINKGLDIAIGCDIPDASGMSTSSAVICYMFMTLADRNNLWEDEKFERTLPTVEDLYGYLGFIENGQNCGTELPGDRGVGTFGGSEDHTAIMSCKPGKLNMFSYCPTRFEGAFNFPSDCTFVIASSGNVAEKTGDKLEDYNNAAFQARDAKVAYNDATGSNCANLAKVVKHVRETSPAGTDMKQAIIDVIRQLDDGKTYPKEEGKTKYPKGSLVTRFEQFYEESEVIVQGVAKAFDSSDFNTLGRLVDLSQQLTDTHLNNLVPATRFLPKAARDLGAIAASAFGAGFGGSVWALVKKSDADAFKAKWEEVYLKEHPENKVRAVFFKMAPGPGAFRI